jgi:calcium/calmodulin-dependent protein kinase kinase 1
LRASHQQSWWKFLHGRWPWCKLYDGVDFDWSFYNEDDPDRCFYVRDNTNYFDGNDDGPPIKSFEDIYCTIKIKMALHVDRS